MKVQNILMVVIAILIIGIAVVASIEPVATPIPPNANVVDELQQNKAAQEIGQMGIQVTYEELGEDDNGYTVRGQTWYYKMPDGSELNTKVILDDDVDPNSYEAHAILYHEMGHIVNVGAADTEAAADEYAASRGYNIVDAYHGIHSTN